MPGSHIPDAESRRMAGVPEDRVAAEASAPCAETIRQVRDISGTAGTHIIAFG